jgi:hypothetical protein
MKNRFARWITPVLAAALLAAPMAIAGTAGSGAGGKGGPVSPKKPTPPKEDATKEPLPADNGFYVLEGGKLVKLAKPNYKQKTLHKKTYVGFPDEKAPWKEFSRAATFVVYEPRLGEDVLPKLKLRSLRFEGERTVQGTKSRTEKATLNMWVRDQKVAIRYHESSAKRGVWYFTPDQPLAPGRYVAFWGKTLGKAAHDQKVNRMFIFEVK